MPSHQKGLYRNASIPWGDRQIDKKVCFYPIAWVDQRLLAVYTT